MSEAAEAEDTVNPDLLDGVWAAAPLAAECHIRDSCCVRKSSWFEYLGVVGR